MDGCGRQQSLWQAPVSSTVRCYTSSSNHQLQLHLQQQEAAAAAHAALVTRQLAAAAVVGAKAAAAASALVLLQLAAAAVVSKASWRCFSGSRSLSLLVPCLARVKTAVVVAAAAMGALRVEQVAVLAAVAGVLRS
jgi:hypothetical protein